MSTCRTAPTEQSPNDETADHIAEIVLDRAESCYLGAIRQAREEATGLLTTPPDSVLAELVEDLAAVAVAAVEAMTELRQARSSGEPDSPSAAATVARRHLTQLAGLGRSAMAAHLVLQIQARAEQC